MRDRFALAYALLESITTPPSTWVCPKNRCPGAHRDPESLAVGELHERGVTRIAGPEHGRLASCARRVQESSADDCRTASSKYNTFEILHVVGVPSVEESQSADRA